MRENSIFGIKNIKLDEVWRFRVLVATILLFKIIVLALFSSNYQNELFIPFVKDFLTNGFNPWQRAFERGALDVFPYHPLMLYIFALFYAPYHFIVSLFPALDTVFLRNIAFGMPNVLADVLILFILRSLMPGRKSVLLIYFTSPVVLYAAYMHAQLDLIPTALSFLSVFFLVKRRFPLAALILGCALATKLHIVAVTPLMIMYAYRNGRFKQAVYFTAISLLTYFFFTAPFAFEEGFLTLVLNNPKQDMLFSSVFHLGEMSLILPLFAILIIYARFTFYKAVNNDLFFTFIGLLFTVFIGLIAPAPGWYLWVIPYFSIFFIKTQETNRQSLLVYFVLNALYLFYFVFIYSPDYVDLIFLNTNISLKIESVRISKIAFTLLESTVVITLYLLYNFGVKSNRIYKQHYATIIGIGGDSGAGKTTLLENLRMLFTGKCVELEGDAEHRWERGDFNWKEYTHLNPKANLLHSQAENLLALKTGKIIHRRDYDHSTGRFTEKKRIRSGEYVMLSGLHPFYLPIMRKIIDLKIYLDIEERLRRHWKIIRDMKKRGYSKDEVVEQIEARSEDASKYIIPQREFADLIIKYFVDDETFIEGGDLDEDKLKLKLTLEASIHLEGVLEYFGKNNVEAHWDYSSDLTRQILIVSGSVSKETIKNAAYENIPNLDELLGDNHRWAEGYNGVVQLIVLIMLSSKLRSGDLEKIV